MENQIAEVLNKIIEVIPGGEHALIGALVLAFEFVFRLMPSKKPLSVMHAVAGVLHGVAVVAGLVQLAVKKLADLLDKVLPQNLQ